MALRVDYVVRETATNLRRNLTLDVRDRRHDRDRADAASVPSLLMKQGVNRSNVRSAATCRRSST